MADRVDRAEVFQVVRALLVKMFALEPDQVQESSHFLIDLRADSLDFVELAVALEDAFAVLLDDIEFMSISTVGALVDIIFDRAR